MRGQAQRKSSNSSLKVAAVVTLAMFFIISAFWQGWFSTYALAQDDPVKALNEEYARLEREGLKENFHRQLSFTILQEYLPPGARMTSGYRSPQKQLDLILRMARARGIATPSSANIADPTTWGPPLAALRQKGIIIAAPTTTPHGTDEAVFDLSGADLNAIQDGLRQAEKAGMVKFKRILFESQNNAVHVEIESVSPKAFNVLGRRKDNPPGNNTGMPGGTTIPGSEDDQRHRMLQQLQDLHDREPDPAKKIDYDRSKRNLLDPGADAAAITALDDEIERHQAEAQQLEDGGARKQAIVKISGALREGRYEDAEKEAEEFANASPNSQQAQDMLIRIKTHRLVSEARYLLEEPGCDECEEAGELIASALELSPHHEGAQVMLEEVDACLAQCKLKRVTVAAVGVVIFFIFAGSIGAYFLLSRPGNFLSSKAQSSSGPAAWVLEGIEGPCMGHIYPLQKEETIIGSQSPPADIEICDELRKISRRHCAIIRNGKRFYVVDESTNGTKLNDREIERGVVTELRQGDRIALADVAVLWLKQM